MISNQSRFDQAIAKIDLENSKDPNMERFNEEDHPKELLYSKRMTEWLLKLAPQSSEELQIAARGQHICRWTSPRDSYPMHRQGYLKWRSELKLFHAERVGEIMKECVYEKEAIARVQSLIKKEKLKTDPESQLLEDVVCLVFLESYFLDFSHKHDEKKLIEILKKTWNKMSNKGHLEALKIQLKPESRDLIEKALAEPT